MAIGTRGLSAGAPVLSALRNKDADEGVRRAAEEALARLDPLEPRIAAAGRTDTGVHATGQVAHADLVRDWPPERLMDATNQHLKPLPVALTAFHDGRLSLCEALARVTHNPARILRLADGTVRCWGRNNTWGIGDGTGGVFGGHVGFHKPSRSWDFKSVGRGKINFELI